MQNFNKNGGGTIEKYQEFVNKIKGLLINDIVISLLNFLGPHKSLKLFRKRMYWRTYWNVLENVLENVPRNV